MMRTILAGGRVVDGSGAAPRRADVLVAGGRIAAVGTGLARADAHVIDCTDRLILPGFVDCHAHADAAVFDPEIQKALLRQGITTTIAGQDGISFAPGDGRYATGYFAGLNGAHPHYRGGGVAALLSGYDGGVAVNVAYLVPLGTVRHAVLGWSERAPRPVEIATMRGLVDEGLADGAVGVSTGLDYPPGMFASTAEITALARPIAERGGVYVTHMRGGYETEIGVGVGEVVAILRDAGGIPGHISHYHGPAELAIDALEAARRDGADLTFDSYPYRAGCTLLSMPVLPSELLNLSTEQVLAALGDPQVRERLVRHIQDEVGGEAFLGRDWPHRMRLAGVPSKELAWASGRTVADAARQAGTGHAEFAVQVLERTGLAVTVVIPLPPGRSVDDLGRLIRHPAQLVGSDGIFFGDHPHPRGWGTTGRLLRRHVIERGDLDWGRAAWHLAGHPASRFALGDRGFVSRGAVADLVVIDPATVRDTATYGHSRSPAKGIDDVLVAGVPVLRGGELTGATPGGGVRRAASASSPRPAPARSGDG